MNDDASRPSRARIDRTNELLQRMLAEVAKTPSTHAIFVDAGYLYAAAGRLVAGHRGPPGLRPRRRGPHRGAHRQGPHDLRRQPAAARLLVRRRPAPHPHRRAAVHRRAARRQGPARQPQRQQPAEGRRLADPLRPGVTRPAPRHQRRGPARRRRGPGLRGRGRAGLRRPGPPVGHRGARGPQPGRAAALGGRQPAHLRPRLLQAVRLPAHRSPPYETAAAARPTREDVRFVGAQIAAKWLAARGRESPGGAAARPPVPARLRSTRTCWSRRRGCSSTRCAARPTCGARCGTASGSTCRRSTEHGDGRRPARDRLRRPPGRAPSQKSTRARAVSQGPVGVGGVLGARDRRSGGRPAAAAIASSSGTGQVSSRSPESTCFGQRRRRPVRRPGPARSHSCRPVAISWAGLLRSQRRRRSPSPSPASPRRVGRPRAAPSPASPPTPRPCPSPASASRSSFDALPAGRRRSAAGPGGHEGERAERRRGRAARRRGRSGRRGSARAGAPARADERRGLREHVPRPTRPARTPPRRPGPGGLVLAPPVHGDRRGSRRRRAARAAR